MSKWLDRNRSAILSALFLTLFAIGLALTAAPLVQP